MYPLMLLQRMFFRIEEFHLLREHGKDVLFFYCVVDGEVVAELADESEELADREARWSCVGDASGVQRIPGLAEVVVLEDECQFWLRKKNVDGAELTNISICSAMELYVLNSWALNFGSCCTLLSAFCSAEGSAASLGWDAFGTPASSIFSKACSGQDDAAVVAEESIFPLRCCFWLWVCETRQTKALKLRIEEEAVTLGNTFRSIPLFYPAYN